ncbi:MAG TPA: ABC transporter transmembrane domain-containing protein, partial [Burkholderiales bacterium]|nr:ABC transporter transmembrane domain-containing protein [Burkholderiales bacterium]
MNLLPSSIRGTAIPGPGAPPQGLLAFYWHFVQQSKGWYAAMFAASLAVALLDTVIPLFIGKLVSLMEATDRQAALAREWPMLGGMIGLVLVIRPLAILADMAIRQNALIPGVTTMIRWQSHWHVIRQSWPFFQNDFAGRIANRVMQTANALRESTMASIRAVWYILVYGTSAYALMAAADWRLGLPTLLWFAGYIVFLRHFVPKLRELAKTSSELR